MAAADDFRHPVTEAVEALGDGWHPLEHEPGGAALDYRRGNLFNEADMRILPPDVAGADNDLQDLIQHHVESAQRPGGTTAAVRIVAALVNPAGPGDEGESVLLLNASPDPVDLAGWQIADKAAAGEPARHAKPAPPGLGWAPG